MSELGKAGVKAFKWSAASTLGRFAIQLAAQVVLARLLGPENYGIFGIGMVVYTFSNFLVGFGFGWSLLQRNTLTDEDIRFAFTWQIIAGTFAMTGLYFAAPFLADYFRDVRVLPVIEWMSLACLINAATSPASNLLQRQLDFKSVGLIQISSYIAGYVVVGIPMAMMGQGAYALVAAWLTQATTALLISYALVRHPLIPLFWYAGASSAFGTGGTVFFTNIVNWLLNNLDRIFIGRILNTHSVGLYTAGYNIATMPNSLLLAALQPAFMAAAAKMQTEPDRIGRVYLQILATTCVLILPGFVFLSAISADLVQMLYGSSWTQTSNVMAILFLGMPAYIVWGLSTPVLWNTGRKKHEFLLQIPILLLGTIGFYTFTQQGIVETAIVASAICVSRAVVTGVAAFKAVGLSPQTLLPHLARGTLISVLAVISAFAGSRISSPFGNPFISLVVSTLLALVLVFLLIWKYPRILGEMTIEMIIRFAPLLAERLKYNPVTTTLSNKPTGKHK